MTPLDPQQSVRAAIYAATHGDPPNRDCLSGSDAKWEGYMLGVEEAACAAEAEIERLRDALKAARECIAAVHHARFDFRRRELAQAGVRAITLVLATQQTRGPETTDV